MTIKTILTALSLVTFTACGFQQGTDENGKPIEIVGETDAPYDDEVIETAPDAGAAPDVATTVTETDAAVPETAPAPTVETTPVVETVPVVEVVPVVPVVEVAPVVEVPAPTPVVTVVVPPPAPVVLHSAPVVIRDGKLLLSAEYTAKAKCAELRGELPGATWTSGPRGTDTDADGYYEFSLNVSGTYRFTYVSVDCTTGAQIDWALYGIKDVLVDLTSEALAPIVCDANSCQNPGSCSIKATFSGSTIAPAGTMATATGC